MFARRARRQEARGARRCQRRRGAVQGDAPGHQGVDGVRPGRAPGELPGAVGDARPATHGERPVAVLGPGDGRERLRGPAAVHPVQGNPTGVQHVRRQGQDLQGGATRGTRGTHTGKAG